MRVIYRRPHDLVHIIRIFLWKTAWHDFVIRVTTQKINGRKVRGLRSSREPPLPDLPSQTRLTQVPVNNGILSILRAAGVHTFFLRLLNHPFNISPEYWLQLWRYILCLDWGHIRVYTGQNSCDCTLKIFAFHYISIWPQFIFWRKSL